MLTKIEITTVKQTGVLGKIALALINKGYKVNRQTITDLEDNRLCLIKLEIESQKDCLKGEFEFLYKEVRQVIKINDHYKEKEIPIQNKQTYKPDLIKNLGNQLIIKFPDIIPLLKKIDYSLSAESRQDVLTKLGKGLGRWQSQKKITRGGQLSLDKILKKLLRPSLKKFLDVEYSNNQFIVNNCPHCYQQEDTTPGCYFITAYMQEFLDTFTYLPSITVHQLHSKANGFQNCVFEIRLTNNNQS